MRDLTEDTKHFLLSMALHLSLILLLIGKIVIFPRQRLDYVRAVRVDFVALPDKDPLVAPLGEEKPVQPTPAISKPVEKKPIEKTAPKISEPPKPKESTVKDQQSAALKRLEALNKIKKLKNVHANTPEGTTYKGNRLNDGNALTGVEKIEHNRYLSQLDMHIKKNWQLPEWLVNKPLTTAVLVRFDENGNLIEKKLIKSSGNPDFDKEALQAIMASLPLPTPPENLIGYFKDYGIELRFPE